MFAGGLVVQVIPHFIASTTSSHTVLRIAPVEIRTIATPDEWHLATRSGKRIVFVGANWNPLVIMFREQFQQFANWCEHNSDYLPMRIDLHSTTSGPMWDLVMELCRTHEIPYGSMKFMGSGVVVWLEDGEVIDSAHIAVPGDEFYPDGFTALKTRTERLDH